MANTHTTLASLFSAIADAIRAKTGGTDQIVADNFPNEIAAIETGIQLPSLTTPGTAADLLIGKQLIDGDGNIVDGTRVEKTPVFEDVSATYAQSGNYYVYTITVSQEVDTFLGLGAYTANSFGFAYPSMAGGDSGIKIIEILSGGWIACTVTVSGNTITFKAETAYGDPGTITDGKICYLPK